MKKLSFVLLLACFVASSISANPIPPVSLEVDTLSHPDGSLEQLPQFPGGNSELLTFLLKKLQYPAKAIKNRTEGVVKVSFVVDRQGRLHFPTIIQEIGDGCGQTVQSVLQEDDMPLWEPGIRNGRPFPVKLILKVRFQLVYEKRP